MAKLLLGDVSGNAALSMQDVVLVEQELQAIAAGKPSVLTADQKRCADVDNDGKVTMNDAHLIAQAVAGQITTFPAGAFLQELPAAVPPQPDMAGLVHSDAVQAIRRVRLFATDVGWAMLWIQNRVDAGLQDQHAVSELWYALNGFDGTPKVTARKLLDIHRYDREPVYLAAWHPGAKVIGIVVNEMIGPLGAPRPDGSLTRTTHQLLYTLDPVTGTLSSTFATLLDFLGVHGGIGDMMPVTNDVDFPQTNGNGWLIGAESDWQANPMHQCTYFFKCSLTGATKFTPGIQITLKVMGSHSVNPAFAWNPAGGWLATVVCDAGSMWGGVLLYSLNQRANIASSQSRIIPGSFLEQTNNQLAGDGAGHFAALWTERLDRQGTAGGRLTQSRLTLFQRPSAGGIAAVKTILLEPPVDADSLGPGLRFTTRILRKPSAWLAFYPVAGASGGTVLRQATVSDIPGVLPTFTDVASILDTASVSVDRAADGTLGIASTTRATSGDLQVQLKTVK
jgi:hypothetical protein